MSTAGRKDPRTRALAATIAGALIGAVGGALIGGSLDGLRGALLGSAMGALALGTGEGVTDLRRLPGETKPEWWRIFAAVFMASALGGLVAIVFGDVRPIAVGIAMGFAVSLVGTVGLLSFRSNRLLLGLCCGLAVGVAAQFLGGWPLAIVGGAVALAYRLLGAALFRGADIARTVGERVPTEQVPFVVPFEARTRYVGAEYFRELAREASGEFRRNAPDVGIVESMDLLRGPTFDPDRLDPLIREFYEHTTRFKLEIRPEWRRRMRPAYRAFKRGLASRIGQANLPFDTEEAQRGVVSYVDTIELPSGDSDGGIETLRGWVRAYEETGEAIYVGVYTIFRDGETGFVSVGFPLPRANFTATLRPYNLDGGGLLLRSHDTGHEYPGHYLSAIEDGALTVIQVPSFSEEIEVFVDGGELRTEHRFTLSGLTFLTLHYEIERAGTPQAPGSDSEAAS